MINYTHPRRGKTTERINLNHPHRPPVTVLVRNDRGAIVLQRGQSVVIGRAV